MTIIVQHEADCMERSESSYREALVGFGLDETNLGFVSLIDDSTLVVIGFSTSLLQTRVSAMAPATHQFTLVLVITAIVVLLFTALRVFVRSVCHALWSHNQDWCTMVLRIVKFVRAAALLLVTHSVSSAILLFWDENQLSWLETLAAIYTLVLSMYFVLQVFHRSK